MIRSTLALFGITILSLHCGNARSPQPDQVAKPRVGTVEIISQPPGATVLLDEEKRIGKTPMTVERPVELPLRLLLIKEGYENYSKTVFVVSGQRTTLVADLKKVKAEILVMAGPIRGAEILVDGEIAGRTPDRVQVDADQEHWVEVRKAGFHVYREKVKFKEKQTAFEVMADMVPLGRKPRPTGLFHVETHSPAMIFLDGKLIGMTPFNKIRIPAKRYTMVVKNELLKKEKRMQITITRDELNQFNVDF